MTYTVVTLDGKEKSNLSLDQVKDLFIRRQINQSSLILSAENPQWQMLKRTFDISQWIPNAAPFTTQNNFSTPLQTHYEQPVTFNQPNNQTQTFYQAETLPSQNKLQNIQSNYAPSHFQYTVAIEQPSVSDERIGLRPASVFFIISALVFGVSTLINKVFLTDSGEDTVYRSGQVVGFLIPVVIDLSLAVKLWKGEKIESTRKWALFWTYFRFCALTVAGLVLANEKGGIFIAVFMFLIGLFYLISVGLLLHGKKTPSTTRVMSAIGSFTVFFALAAGIMALAVLGKYAPDISKINFENPQIEKYKIEGTEFQDKTTGAKVLLPENWVMLNTNNPIASSPEARMVAVSQNAQRLAMLEVVPVPAQLDMRRVSSSMILDELSNGVVKSMEEAAKKESYFGNNSFREITRLNVSIGTHPAKLLVVERQQNRMQVKGHIIITYDELTFYVLHTWCPTNEYETAQNDFTFFEKNFSVPEKINSVFNQTADKESREK
jgi:hypothetical protein